MAVALLRELEDDPSTRADLSALPFYNSALEPRLDSPITKLKVTRTPPPRPLHPPPVPLHSGAGSQPSLCCPLLACLDHRG